MESHRRIDRERSGTRQVGLCLFTKLIVPSFRMQNELVRVREEGERQIASNSQEKVQNDLKLQSLQAAYDKVRDNLNARIQDIERYTLPFFVKLFLSLSLSNSLFLSL